MGVRVSVQVRKENLGLLANGSSGSWDVSVDETLTGPDRWFAQIEGPAISLAFEIPSLDILSRMIGFLGRGRSVRDVTSPGSSSNGDTELAVSKPKATPVTLLKDDEYDDRCFVLVGPTDNPVVRISILGDDLHHVVEALRQTQEEIAALRSVGRPVRRGRKDRS
jgi:hypothetical protein